MKSKGFRVQMSAFSHGSNRSTAAAVAHRGNCSCYIHCMSLQRSVVALLALLVLLTGVSGAWAMATSTASSDALAVWGCDDGPDGAPLDSDLECDHRCHVAAHLMGVTSVPYSAALELAGSPGMEPGPALRTILLRLHLPPPRIDSLL